jgi:hypothetical protein
MSIDKAEAYLWQELIQQSWGRFLRGREAEADDKLGESFGLHDVGAVHGWYEDPECTLMLCRCREGYFALRFHRAVLFALLISESPGGVVRFLQCEYFTPEGKWRRAGAVYDRNAPDQLEELAD